MSATKKYDTLQRIIMNWLFSLALAVLSGDPILFFELEHKKPVRTVKSNAAHLPRWAELLYRDLATVTGELFPIRTEEENDNAEICDWNPSLGHLCSSVFYKRSLQ